jgi:hypothetical protein
MSGLTREQWRELDQLFRDNEPQMPPDEELGSSDWINAVTFAGSGSGVLMNTETSVQFRFFYMNAIVALWFARDIMKAGEEWGWWKEDLAYQRNPRLRQPRSADADIAEPVISLATIASPNGLFVKFALGKRQPVFRMTKNIAMEIMRAVAINADRFGWAQARQPWSKLASVHPTQGQKDRSE